MLLNLNFLQYNLFYLFSKLYFLGKMANIERRDWLYRRGTVFVFSSSTSGSVNYLLILSFFLFIYHFTLSPIYSSFHPFPYLFIISPFLIFIHYFTLSPIYLSFHVSPIYSSFHPFSYLFIISPFLIFIYHFTLSHIFSFFTHSFAFSPMNQSFHPLPIYSSFFPSFRPFSYYLP